MQITIRGHHLAITPAIEENIRLKVCTNDQTSGSGQ